MKKLTLNFSDLKIDSFETSKAVSSKGTVKGNYETETPDCNFTRTCPPTMYQTQGICCPISLNFEDCESKEICR